MKIFCSSKGELINRLWHIPAMEFYLSIRGHKKIDTHNMKGFQNPHVSERRQAKEQYILPGFIYVKFQKWKAVNIDRKQSIGSWRWGPGGGWVTTGHDETFGGDEIHAHYLDCGDDLECVQMPELMELHSLLNT
jgi:hypothetical protein